MKRLIQVAMVAVALAWAATAEAAFILRVEVLAGPGAGNGQVVQDNAAGDLNPMAGAIVFSSGIGTNFIVNTTTGISKPVTPQTGYIDVSSLHIASSGAGQIRVTLFNDGFDSTTDPASLIRLMVGGTLSAPGGSTITFQGWGLNGTSGFIGAPTATVGPLGPMVGFPPAGSAPACSSGPLSFGPGAYSGTCVNSFAASGAYSVFNQAIVTFTGAGTVSFNLETQAAVPEPGSMILLGTGLLGMAAIARRRMRKA